jgi:septum site-determining protein MinC
LLTRLGVNNIMLPTTNEEDTEIKVCMQLKGGLFPLTTLQLLDADLHELENQLNLKIQQAPNFFNNAPIVIDLYYLTEKNLEFIDFVALKNFLISKNLVPVGVKNASPLLQKLAIEANLAILRSNSSFENYSKHPGSKIANANQENNNINNIKDNNIIIKETNLKSEKNKLMTTPIRSGQQIYAPDGDVTVIGSVSNGAEILADGNIHIYGPLRGRALAGINNNTQARIFCSSLEADLISIAGQFKISENIDQKFWKKSVQIQLFEGKLLITEF